MDQNTTKAASETSEDFEPIEIAIEDGPVTPDFDGRSRGWRASIVIDPEDREVTLYTCIGSGVPMSVWHGLQMQIGIDIAASGESVRELLESDEGQSLLNDLIDCYQGSRWDGSNTVGSWGRDEDGFLTCDGVTEKLSQLLEQAETYWSASDWLACDWSGCKSEVAKIIMSATSDEAEEKALGEHAEMLVDTGRSDGSLLDIDDVGEQIELLVSEVEQDDEDDTFWVVTGPARTGEPADAHKLAETDMASAIADTKNLGETWWVVEATTPIKAWRAARKLRTGAGSGRDELIRLESEWRDDNLATLVAALT